MQKQPPASRHAGLGLLVSALMLASCSEDAAHPHLPSDEGGSWQGDASGSAGRAGGTSAAGNVTGGGASQGGQGAGGGPLGGTAAAGSSGASTAGSAGAGGATPTSTLGQCALSFPYRDQPAVGTWLGGDSAYSILLDEHKALWTFQDTFVGKHGQTARAGSTLIANSYAYVSCQGGTYDIQYFWRHENNGVQAVMSDGAANQRFWPQQPILHGGFLFQAMTRVENGADEIGTVLARVKNPLDTPDTWQVEYYELASLSGLGKGTLVQGDYMYLFGNAGQALVTRIALSELVKPTIVPKDLLEYLAADGSWKPGLDPNAAKKLGFSANVGTSFRYLNERQQWLVLFTNTAGWPAPNISISTAPALEGPWRKPVDVYTVPEMTPGSAEYDKDTVCYAAIEHPESNATPESDLLFSYTCNSLVFEKQLANLGIYLPKVVRVKLPT